MSPTPGVCIRVMGVLAGGRIRVHGLASIIVRAQHFKANFSITVKLISESTALCFDCLIYTTCVHAKLRRQNNRTHRFLLCGMSTCGKMQNGSALLALLLMDVKKKRKKKHETEVTKSPETLSSICGISNV